MSDRTYYDMRCLNCEAEFEISVGDFGRKQSPAVAYCPLCGVDLIAEFAPEEDAVEETT